MSQADIPTTERIVKSLSYWHNEDLDSLFDALLSVNVYKIEGLGDRKALSELQSLIKIKRSQDLSV